MKLLDTNALADRLGVGPRTVTEYLYRSRRLRAKGITKTGTYGLPEPDDTYGGRPVWKESTIARWERSCPGQGARTDVRRGPGRPPGRVAVKAR